MVFIEMKKYSKNLPSISPVFAQSLVGLQVAFSPLDIHANSHRSLCQVVDIQNQYFPLITFNTKFLKKKKTGMYAMHTHS